MSFGQTSIKKSVLFGCLVGVLLTNVVLAQAPATPKPKQYPPDPAKLANKKAEFQKVSRVLRTSGPLTDAAKAQLDSYYKSLVFREFTTSDNWGKLPDLRASIRKDVRTARSAEAIKYVNTITAQQMRSFTQSRFGLHPAVRYNAMLLLGDLNTSERAPGPDGRPGRYPAPFAPALDLIVTEYRSESQIDAVRVAALVGIKRHMILDRTRPTIPGAKKKVIVDEMIALLNAAPPAGRSVAGHTWMQRSAIDILSAAGMVGAYSAANSALEKIVRDTSAPMSLRCTASEALAHWSPNSKEKVDATGMSKDMGLIAVKACKEELDRIAALVKQEEDMARLRELVKKANPTALSQLSPAASYGGDSGEEEGYGGADIETMMSGAYGGEDEEGGMEGYGEMANMESMYGELIGGTDAAAPVDPRVIWSQRRLKHQLTCIKRGLSGMTVAAGKGTQHEAAVTKVSEAVNVAYTFTDPPAEKPDLEGLTESIQQAIKALAFLTPAAAPAAAAPVPELPDSVVPPGADPTTEAPADAATSEVPADPTEPSAVVPGDLPPGL